MQTAIADIQKKHAGQIDHLDLELLIAHILKKPREFVLAHPEYEMSPLKIENLKLKIAQRMRGEPLAYILGYKEFFGLPFLVSPATLIPRPETELLVEMALDEVRSHQSSIKNIIDIGTGSGNIIISIAKAIENFKFQISNFKFYGIDLSKDALTIARRNAKKNNVDKKIKFIHGNLLTPIVENRELEIENSKMIILANLPYLSREIYNATDKTVKKYEPKSALYSPQEGLRHYGELLKQIANLNPTNCIALLEISPEQKVKILSLIKKHFPASEIECKKDLASKWRLVIIRL